MPPEAMWAMTSYLPTRTTFRWPLLGGESGGIGVSVRGRAGAGRRPRVCAIVPRLWAGVNVGRPSPDVSLPRGRGQAAQQVAGPGAAVVSEIDTVGAVGDRVE